MSPAVEPILDDVFALDMAVLAYHAYNQSLLWPLDPYYEEWSRIGSSRRDNTLANAHRLVAGNDSLRGPGSTRGWPTNDKLDPVVTSYDHLHPWDASITNDGESHRLLSTHESIVQPIRDLVVCEYTDQREGRPIQPAFRPATLNPEAGEGATDRLYAFEGATGSIDGLPPAWSLMGVVLERHDPTNDSGDYHVHIAYRGSQSGSAYRAAYQGVVLEAGNPDWVTDMEIWKTVADRRFSPKGKVVRGLRDATVTTLGSIIHCLSDIAERNGRPPTQVHITGHSLGGALATQLAAAFAVGDVASSLPPGLRDWPWASLDLTSFSAPKAGDEDFARHFDAVLPSRRVLADGDPITEFPANTHVGQEILLHSGVSGTANHEPAIVRRSMVQAIRWQQPDLLTEPRLDHQPWRSFDSLGTALLAAEDNGDTVSGVFARASAYQDSLFVDLVSAVIESPSSYRVPFTKFAPELRRRSRRVQTLFGASINSIEGLRSRLRRFRGVQPGSSIENYLRRVLIILQASRNGWSATDLLDDEAIAKALGTHRHPKPTADHVARAVGRAAGPPPNSDDIRRVKLVLWMRQQHRAVVNDGTVKKFRRRVPPTSVMPHLVPACSHYPGLDWVPRELMVPTTMPKEAQLLRTYTGRYYGLGKAGFNALAKSPIRPEVPWDPSYEWNKAFPPTGDGWEHPTSDETFVRLRTEGPNPFMLRRSGDDFVLDFTELLDDVMPAIVARFSLIGDALQPRDITIGSITHTPDDTTWDQAKRVVNAADIRCIAFGRHLLDVHFLVGQAFALSAYSLPTWHVLRPFMHFFSFGTLQVNDFAYQAFFKTSAYFIASGFMTADASASLFSNRIKSFDLDEWIPPKDIAARGIDQIPGHPYVEDALTIWPEFEGIVNRHLDDLGFDDEAIAADKDLQTWYITLTKLLPNTDANAPLTRARLTELCSAFLYNNVVHEVCGDLSPILGSEDPDDKAIINLKHLVVAIGDGRLTTPIPAPTMSDVFLMDQASYTSRFNVGGNNLLNINAARWVDDPKLCDAIEDMQATLRRLEQELIARNNTRQVRFTRMQPSKWEASISF